MNSEQANTKLGRPVRTPGEKPTREKIFDAAVDLFAEQGYDKASIRKIADKVGITESAVYRHYSSKQAIFKAILSYVEERMYTPLPIEEGRKDEISIFRGLLEPLPELLSAEPILIKITRIIYSEMHHNEEIRRYFRKEFISRADDYIEALFKRQIDDGKITPCNPGETALIFNAFRSEWMFRYFILKPDEDADTKEMKNDLEKAICFFERLQASQ